MTSIDNQYFSIFIKLLGNNIRDTGAKSLSEVLKMNTTLASLNLTGGHKTIHKMTLINKSLVS